MKNTGRRSWRKMIAIYARVSTEEQLKGYSIEGQIEDCIKLAGTDNVIQYIDDGYTGEILNRPNLTKMLEDVEKGLIEKLICYDPDRLSRKLLNQLLITEKLDKHQVKLLFVKSDYKNDPEGNLYFQVRGAFSEFDKAKIKHNTMTGRYRKAKRGKVVKNGNMYGYDYDRTTETYTINEKEAGIIKMIFDYYTDANSPFKGINGIAVHLTEIGIPTKKGKKTWHRQVVRQMLMNESYTGIYYQNRYDTEGDYVKKQAGERVEHGKLRPKEEWVVTEIPPIITTEQFEYAQALLSEAKRRSTSVDRHPYLLSGLVRCGRCGETMNGRKTKSHGKDFYIYQCRKSYAGAKSKGCGRQMSENKLNGFVWGEAVELLDNVQKINEHHVVQKKSYIYEEIEHLKKQIGIAKNGRNRLLRLITISESDEDIDLQEIKEKMKELRVNEISFREKLEVLLKEAEEEDNKKSIYALEEAIKHYLKAPGLHLDIYKRQNILRLIIREVEVIDSETIHIRTF